MFSFNAPYGACDSCNGLGTTLEVDENKLIIDENLSLYDGGIAIPGASTKKGWNWELFMTMAKAYKIDVNKKVKDLTKDERNTIFHGNSKEFKFKWTGDSFSYNGSRSYEGIVKILKEDITRQIQIL